MRTTVEISEAQYVALRTMAAERGIRGFSPLISEAIGLLLARRDEERIEEALGLAGILDEVEADELETHVEQIRARPGRTTSGEDGRDVA